MRLDRQLAGPTPAAWPTSLDWPPTVDGLKPVLVRVALALQRVYWTLFPVALAAADGSTDTEGDGDKKAVETKETKEIDLRPMLKLASNDSKIVGQFAALVGQCAAALVEQGCKIPLVQSANSIYRERQAAETDCFSRRVDFATLSEQQVNELMVDMRKQVQEYLALATTAGMNCVQVTVFEGKGQERTFQVELQSTMLCKV